VSPQLRLPIGRAPDYRRARFVASASNAEALAWLEPGRTWPGNSLALIGPEGSGKTHLAHIWASENDGLFLTEPPESYADLDGVNLIIEAAETWPDPEGLFHLINMTAISGRLLLTSRTRPGLWPAALPDLRSRLNALTVAELHEPDDAVLTGILEALFLERHIRPKKDVIPYLLYRMERSVTAARDIVARLDDAAAAQSREINRALAIEVLEVDSVINDLFDDLG
jgi:chromosomal replication initiation ATPase DnaA